MEVLSLRQQKVWSTYLFKSFLSQFFQKPVGRGKRMRAAGRKGGREEKELRCVDGKMERERYTICGAGPLHMTFYKSNCPSVWWQKLPLVSPLCLPHLKKENGSLNLLLPVAVIQARVGSLSATRPAQWHLFFFLCLSVKRLSYPGSLYSFTPFCWPSAVFPVMYRFFSPPFLWPTFPPARSLISWCKSAFPREGRRL